MQVVKELHNYKIVSMSTSGNHFIIHNFDDEYFKGPFSDLEAAETYLDDLLTKQDERE